MEKDRFKEFVKFINDSDEFGNTAYDYLGSDMFPTLEDLFECFLRFEKPELAENSFKQRKTTMLNLSKI